MRLLTTHWTLDSGEWRSELRETFQLWSQWSITTFLRHLPVYSPHSPHTRLSVIKKINKQKLVLTKSCNCCSFNLLSGICNALIKLNFQSATSQNRHRHLDFWSCDPIAPAICPFLIWALPKLSWQAPGDSWPGHCSPPRARGLHDSVITTDTL